MRAAMFLAMWPALLAGCAAVGPDYHAPVLDAPAHWSDWHGGDESLAAPAAAEQASAARPGDWSWLGDPVLARLQGRAASANGDLQSAALRFAQARVQQTMASAGHGVQAGARAGVAWQRQSESGAGTRLIDAITPNNRDQLVQVLSDPFTLYQAGFDASWELDLWGRVRRSVEAADAGVQGAAADLHLMQTSIAAEVARAYFQLRMAQAQLRLVHADIASAQDTLGLVDAKVKGGLADDSAQVAQRAHLAQLESTLPQWLAREAAAANQITLLCGARPGELRDELADTGTGLHDAAWPDLALGVPSEFVHHRPDIAAAEARLHAATAQVGVAVADLYPRIVLGASFGLESVGAERFGDWGARQWSVGPSLSLPLFDHGRRRATVTLRELGQQRAAVAYQQAVLQAWHEVDGAVSAYRAAHQRRQRLVQRVAQSRDLAALARARYDEGLTDVLPQLEAERVLRQAERELSVSGAGLGTAWAVVIKAMGDDGGPPAHLAMKTPGDAAASRPATR
jgi:NodT family efflux transporter outer membrane factor (OMF) lipoprotein